MRDDTSKITAAVTFGNKDELYAIHATLWNAQSQTMIASNHQDIRVLSIERDEVAYNTSCVYNKGESMLCVLGTGSQVARNAKTAVHPIAHDCKCNDWLCWTFWTIREGQGT